MKVYVKIYYPDHIDEPIQITGVTTKQPMDNYEEFELEENEDE